MGFTDKGYMEEKLFIQYLEHFIQSIPSTRPALLMLDGHSSHISLPSIDLCRRNDILLYALPSNTTHILQPCEIPFRKLKIEYDRISEQYRNSNNGALVTKYTFAKIVGEAYLETYTEQAIKNAFRSTGIWPVNRTVINQSRLEMSLVTENFEEQTEAESEEVNEGEDQFDSDSGDRLDGGSGDRLDGGGGDRLDGGSGDRLDSGNGISLDNRDELEILRMENKKLLSENARLREEIEVRKHPGTSDPRQALKYLVPFKRSIAESGQPKRRKSFKFSTLLTENETRDQFVEIDVIREQKKEEVQRKKMEREKKREERELQKEQKKACTSRKSRE